tara:strand:+ start:104 stop:961 length:858 start_codon:yes stop_codon:yes gene_type:complete
MCKKALPATKEFFNRGCVRKDGTRGLNPRCISCVKIKNREGYLANREKRLEYRKKYYDTNRELILEKDKAKYWSLPQEERDRINAAQRAAYANMDPEEKKKMLAEKKEHYYNNHEEMKKRHRDHQAKHADRINKKRRDRTANDPEYRDRLREIARNSYRRNAEKKREYSRWRHHNDPKTRWRDIRNGATKKRDLVFEVPFEVYEKEFYGADCHYCGEPNCNGLDRKDSSEGYTLDNVVSCCYSCNCKKWKTPYEEYVEKIGRGDLLIEQNNPTRTTQIKGTTKKK